MSNFKTKDNSKFNNMKNLAEILNKSLKDFDINKINRNELLELLLILQNTEDFIGELEKKFFADNKGKGVKTPLL